MEDTRLNTIILNSTVVTTASLNNKVIPFKIATNIKAPTPQGNPINNKSRCQICKHITTVSTLIPRGSTHKIQPLHFTCNSSNVIYLVFCFECDKSKDKRNWFWILSVSVKKKKKRKYTIWDNFYNFTVATLYTVTIIV